MFASELHIFNGLILHIDNDLQMGINFALILILAILFLLIYRLFSERKFTKKLKSEVDAHRVELLDKNELQKALFDGNVDPIIIFNTKNQIVSFNKSAEELFGYDLKNLIGKSFPGNELVDHKFPKWLSTCIKGSGISGISTFIKMTSGTMVPVSISISPIYNSVKEVTNLSFWYRDVSGDYKYQAALEQSEETYRGLFENNNDAILVLRKSDKKIIDSNAQASEMYGYKYNEFLNSTLALISFSVFDGYNELDRVISKKKKIGEAIHKTKDGLKLHIEFNASLLTYKGEEVILILSRDVSERKAHEERLYNSIKEKEVLVKEIHHRVKNNMQLINSLLDLQVTNLSDPEAVKVIVQSQYRIRVMSIVYQRLYETEDMHSIDSKKLVESIVGYLYDVHKGADHYVHLEYDFDKFTLELDEAIPVSLILCELISNSLIHAFPEKGYSNTLNVSFKLLNNSNQTGNCQLIVKDNGEKFPKDINPLETKSLGLQLVNILTKQLKGSISYNFEKATEFTITFAASQTS